MVANTHGETTHTDRTGVRERPRYDDVNTTVILLVGIISAICTILIIAFVQGLCYRWESSFMRSRLEVENRALKEYINTQKTSLAGDSSDPNRISIEASMEKVLGHYAALAPANAGGGNADGSDGHDADNDADNDANQDANNNTAANDEPQSAGETSQENSSGGGNEQ